MLLLLRASAAVRRLATALTRACGAHARRGSRLAIAANVERGAPAWRWVGGDFGFTPNQTFSLG
jgi:hypothetical protein